MRFFTVFFLLGLVSVALSVITCSDSNEELDCSLEKRCENTCSNPDAGQLPGCREDCGFQMCKCGEGYLRHEGKCVAVEDCPK